MAPLQTEDDLQRAESFLTNIGIPSPPQVIMQLGVELIKPDPEYNVVVKLVMRDAALSAKVVKTINSPLFGLRKKVTSIEHALTMLGLGLFKRVVLLSSLKETLAGGVNRSRYERLWEHNAAVARVCEELARHFQRDCTPEMAYMAGLFHDCGIPLLMKKFAHYDPWDHYFFLDEAVSILDYEFLHYQTNHCAVGCLVARSWNLSAEISLAIRHHHRRDFPEDLREFALARQIWAFLRSAQCIGSFLRWKRNQLQLPRFAFENRSVEEFFDQDLLNALGCSQSELLHLIQMLQSDEHILLSE